jgi:hypothetical protein
MNEYEVNKGSETDSKGYDSPYWYIQASDGRAVVGLEHEQDAHSANRALNEETEALRAQLTAAQSRVKELEAQIAQAQATLPFLADEPAPDDATVFSAFNAPESEAQESVTLVYSDNPEMLDDYTGHDYDVDVVGWLAEHQITAGTLCGDFAVTNIGESIQAFVYNFCSDITPSYLTDESYFDKYFRLNPEFNTPANRAAIAKRRKELGLD